MLHLLRHITIIIYAVLLTMLPLASSAQEDDEEVDVIQQEIDSLLAATTIDSPDSVKAMNYYLVSAKTEYVDTSLKYSTRSLMFCKPEDTTLRAKNYCNIAWAHLANSDFNAAYKQLNKGITLLEQRKDSTLLPTAYMMMARLFDNQFIADSALQYLNSALDICIRTCDTATMTICYNTLGDMSFNKRFYQSAENYYRKALQITTESGDIAGMAVSTQWIGNIHILYEDSIQDGTNLRIAKDLFRQSIALHDSANSDNPYYIQCKYDSHGDLADAYIKLAKYTDDHRYADSCLVYYKIAEQYFLSHGYDESYLDLSRVYMQYLMYYHKYREAEKFLLDLEKQYFVDDTYESYKREHHLMLKEVYRQLGDWQKAFANLEKEYEYASRLTNDSSMTALANSQTAQAMMIERINQENAERAHAERQKRMYIIIFSLAIVLVLIAALTIAIHRAFKIKQRSNTELLLKNETLNNQKAEIETQRDEIEIQKNIITQQWEEVETANRKILESINYAQRIQNAAISSQKEIDELFGNNFVFYRPRNIVSGDFYRAVKCGRYSVMITADCTGHGIPGAFLSMLGISALKEYMTTEDDAQNPGIVLDKMRSFIKSTLNAENDDSPSDGMEMTVCCLDLEKMEMKYAIANQTAYIVRQGKPIILRGDKMTIGKSLIESKSFKTYSQAIQHGDMLYMFSDGIQDQMSFVDGERVRFSSQRLRSSLIKASPLPVREQLDTIQQAVTEWQGDDLQMDDMTLVGIRIN